MEDRETSLVTRLLSGSLKVGIGITVLCIIVVAVAYSALLSTVENGTYQVRQWPYTGTVSVRTEPGTWWKFFGDVTTWPKSETFYFTADKEGDTKDDHGDASIEVTFNDGSRCKISGTCRVDMPRSHEQIMLLIGQYGMKSHADVEAKLVTPVLRNSLILTANLMTARESYSERRIDFVSMAWDQVQNGLFEVSEEPVETKDPVTGFTTIRKVKTIVRDKLGKPVRQPHSSVLETAGIVLSNFEIKDFIYEPKVQEQIRQQQEATMAIVTAAAQAKRAEQDKLRIEAEGKAAVSKAQYEKEQEKIREVTDANKKKEVAEIAAAQELAVAKQQKEQALVAANRDREVADLAVKTADMTKQAQILLGEGEAGRKKLVMAADGALEQKLATYREVQEKWADAFAKRQVPHIIMGGKDGNQDSGTAAFIELLSIKAAKDLELDLAPKPAK